MPLYEPSVVTVFSRTVILTDAQIKALPTTPVEVLAAPGSGKMHIVLLAVFYLNRDEGAYGNVTVETSTLRLAFPSRGGATSQILNSAPLAELTTFLSEVGLTERVVVLQGTPFDIYSGVPVALGEFAVDRVNQPVQVIADNTGDFTGGHAANTLKVTVLYTIIDV